QGPGASPGQDRLRGHGRRRADAGVGGRGPVPLHRGLNGPGAGPSGLATSRQTPARPATARSTWRPMPSASSSSPGRVAIIKPTESPDDVVPQGTLAAGHPRTLNGAVLRRIRPLARKYSVSSTRSAILGGRIGIVGATIAS